MNSLMTQRESPYKSAASLNKVVAVLCYGRSGSVFLQSLLDGHPDLIVTAALNLHPFYAFFEENRHLRARELVSRFVRDFSVIFNANDGWRWEAKKGDYATNWGFTSMGANRDEVLVADKEIFYDTLAEILNEHSSREKSEQVPRKLFFQAVHVAYQKSIGRSVHSGSVMVYPLHAPYPQWQASQFAEDFPDAKYVFMIREPITTFTSLFRYSLKTGINRFEVGSDHFNGLLIGGEPHRLRGSGSVRDLANSILPMNRNIDPWHLRSRAVRLEDLHRQSKLTLERLGNWLEIPWNDCLLQSTFHGLKWWNSATSAQVSGFTEVTIAEKPKDDVLTSIDVFRLRVLASRKYAAWDYGTQDELLAGWLLKLAILPLLVVPFKMELISYSAALASNRVSWFTRMMLIGNAFVVGRRRLFTAWLSAISLATPEANLLK